MTSNMQKLIMLSMPGKEIIFVDPKSPGSGVSISLTDAGVDPFDPARPPAFPILGSPGAGQSYNRTRQQLIPPAAPSKGKSSRKKKVAGISGSISSDQAIAYDPVEADEEPHQLLTGTGGSGKTVSLASEPLALSDESLSITRRYTT